MTSHRITSHYMTSHDITSHHITLHDITWHHITWHDITSHYITSHYMTSHHITLHDMTSHHITLHASLRAPAGRVWGHWDALLGCFLPSQFHILQDAYVFCNPIDTIWYYIPVVPRQGGGGSVKNRKPIGGWLLWITHGRANPLMDRKVVGVVFFGVVEMVAVVTWSVTSSTTAGCSVV